MSDHDEHKPYAWAKLNAYGFVLAALALLALLDLIHPAGTEFSRAAGEVPAGQGAWTIGFGVAGLLLLVGFLRTDRISETAGLAILTLATAAQTVVAFTMLGWTEFSLTRLALLGIVAGCTWARCSVLWSSDGIAVTIPPRNLGGHR